MHTPIGVKPVAGSKEWREAWQKRAFAHISNGYKYICLLYTSPSPRDELNGISYAVFCLKKKKKKKKNVIVIKVKIDETKKNIKKPKR